MSEKKSAVELIREIEKKRDSACELMLLHPSNDVEYYLQGIIDLANCLMEISGLYEMRPKKRGGR